MTTETSPLTKMTVNLNQPARAALDEAAELTGDSRTDTVNRALLVYAEMVRRQRGGWQVYLTRRVPGWMGRLFGDREWCSWTLLDGK